MFPDSYPSTTCSLTTSLASDLDSSTQETLLSVTNIWHFMLAKHTQIAAVFLDVKKAFDSVPHNRLIKSLHSIGIQGPLLNWFRDYFTSTSQHVVLDGKSSTTTPVTSGVPQGSILGPLMFNIFMNSISKIPVCGLPPHALCG